MCILSNCIGTIILLHIAAISFACIMYKNTRSDKISMIILNLEIVNSNRCFQNLMLYFLDNYILAVDENEDITGTELNRIRPSLDGGIEGMRGNSNYG